MVKYHGVSPLKKYFPRDLAALAAKKARRYGGSGTLRVLKGKALIIELHLESLNDGLVKTGKGSNNDTLPQNFMTAEAENADGLSGTRKAGEELTLTNCDGLLLIKQKRKQGTP